METDKFNIHFNEMTGCFQLIWTVTNWTAVVKLFSEYN